MRECTYANYLENDYICEVTGKVCQLQGRLPHNYSQCEYERKEDKKRDKYVRHE